MKNLFTENVTKTNIRVAKFLNLKMKTRFFKKLPSKLYPFNIYVYFKHQNNSCTLLKIVYIIQVWKTWIFLNNMIIYNFTFICIVKRKTMELWFQFLHIHNEFKDG
jgi:hypothetical protein